jgi:hypothetical protein
MGRTVIGRLAKPNVRCRALRRVRVLERKRRMRRQISSSLRARHFSGVVGARGPGLPAAPRAIASQYVAPCFEEARAPEIDRVPAHAKPPRDLTRGQAVGEQEHDAAAQHRTLRARWCPCPGFERGSLAASDDDRARLSGGVAHTPRRAFCGEIGSAIYEGPGISPETPMPCRGESLGCG